MSKDQNGLFTDGNGLEAWYDEHWQGMPEFSHKDLRPVRSIIVHFQDTADVQKFAESIGQRITSGTKFIWYPEVSIGVVENQRWVDDETA